MDRRHFLLDKPRRYDSQGRVTVDDGKPLDKKAYLPKGTVPSLTTFDVKVLQNQRLGDG